MRSTIRWSHARLVRDEDDAAPGDVLRQVLAGRGYGHASECRKPRANGGGAATILVDQ